MNARRLGHRALFFLFFCGLILKDPCLATTLERPPLILGQGEQRLLKVPGLKKYTLGGNVVRILSFKNHFTPTFNAAAADFDSLLIKAMAPGLGDIWVWKQDGSTEHRLIRIQTKAEGGLNPNLERALSRLNEV